jgi:hypothetical protein
VSWIIFDCGCETTNIGFADGGSAPIYIDCKDHRRQNRRCRRIPERVWCLTWQLGQAAIYAKTRNLPMVLPNVPVLAVQQAA